ncbi:MAG: hypothetical protein D6722_04490, partial [Bacteroidetes bacterium]
MVLVAGILVAGLALGSWQWYRGQARAAAALSVAKDTVAQADNPTILYGVPVEGLQVAQADIQPNESLSEILSRYNIPASLIHQVGQFPREVFDVRRLQAKKPYTVIHQNDSAHTAQAFVYH